MALNNGGVKLFHSHISTYILQRPVFNLWVLEAVERASRKARYGIPLYRLGLLFELSNLKLG